MGRPDPNDFSLFRVAPEKDEAGGGGTENILAVKPVKTGAPTAPSSYVRERWK